MTGQPASASWDPASVRTLPELIARRSAVDPDGLYFTLFGERLSCGQLDLMSRRYAGAFAALGLGRGDTIALVLPTCQEFFFAFFGALALGAVPVPLYPTLAPELKARIFTRAEAQAVVTVDWFRDDVEAARAEAPLMRHYLTPDRLETGSPPARLPEPREDDLCFLQYTSGSTAAPRGVMLSQANVMATIRLMVEAVGFRSTDTLVSWLPLYHDMGLIGCGFCPLYTGSRLVLLPPDLKSPRAWLEAITEHRAAFTVSPDFGYRNCVRNVRDTDGLDLSSLRMALSGAEPVRLSTIRAFEERFGVKNVFCPAYGLAEATLAIAIWPPGEPIRLDVSQTFVSVGRPCPGVRVAIARPDEAPGAAAAGEVGEILVQSPGVMQGYYREPDASARALRDGWLHTGDLGFLDGDGYLYITGRIKDVIIVAGQNVVSADLEEIVDGLPGIRYSAAIGIESARTGTQRLHIVAEVRDALPPDQLSALARGIAAEVHRHRGLRPARVLLVSAHTIPKTSSGKIQHAALAAQVAGGAIRDRVLHETGSAGG